LDTSARNASHRPSPEEMFRNDFPLFHELPEMDKIQQDGLKLDKNVIKDNLKDIS
jgi:hypothetical protein